MLQDLPLVLPVLTPHADFHSLSCPARTLGVVNFSEDNLSLCFSGYLPAHPLTSRWSTSTYIAGHEGQQMGLCRLVRTSFGVRRLLREASHLAGHLSCFLAHITHPGVPPSPVPAWLPAGSPLCWHQPVPCPLPQLVVPRCPISTAKPLGWQMFRKSGAVVAASAFCPALPHVIILVFCSVA